MSVGYDVVNNRFLLLFQLGGYGEGEGVHKELAGVEAGVAVRVAREAGGARAAGRAARVLRVRRRRVQRPLHRQGQARHTGDDNTSIAHYSPTYMKLKEPQMK